VLLTEEPTNGFGHYGCGFCRTWAQTPAALLDESGLPRLHPETGLPVVENDQAASCAEMNAHVEQRHPLVLDGDGGEQHTGNGNPVRANVDPAWAPWY
jgi:hypothetical protein